MDEDLRKKCGKILVLYYFQRKRKSYKLRQNILRFLEVKLRSQQRRIVIYQALVRQYINIYRELNAIKTGKRRSSCRKYKRNEGWWNTVNVSITSEHVCKDIITVESYIYISCCHGNLFRIIHNSAYIGVFYYIKTIKTKSKH